MWVGGCGEKVGGESVWEGHVVGLLAGVLSPGFRLACGGIPHGCLARLKAAR